MARRPWDEADKEILRLHGAQCDTVAAWNKLGNRLGRSGDAVRMKYHAMQAQEDAENNQIEPIADPDFTPTPGASFETPDSGDGEFSFIYVSDTHGELIDQSCREAIRDFIAAYKPDQRFHGGDAFDMRPLRNGAGAEDRASSLMGDVEAGIEFLEEYKPHRITWGNHDARLWDLAGSLRESFEIDAARLLRDKIENVCRSMAIVTTPYEKETGWQEIAPGRLIGHGFASSMYPAKVMAMHFGSTITGHVHAFDYHRLDNLRRDESYVSGCCCEINQPYNRAHRRTLKHEHVFLAGKADTNTGDWQIWPVRKRSNGRWFSPFPA